MGFTGMEREELSSLQPSRTKCSDNCLSDCVCARVCGIKGVQSCGPPPPLPKGGRGGRHSCGGCSACACSSCLADLVQTEDVEKFQCALRRVEGLVRRNPLELPEVREGGWEETAAAELVSVVLSRLPWSSPRSCCICQIAMTVRGLMNSGWGLWLP